VSECASWVQAWGSILAIVGAAFVARHAHNLQTAAKRKDEAENGAKAIEIAGQLAAGGAQAIQKLFDIASPTTNWGDIAKGLSELRALETKLKDLGLAGVSKYETIEPLVVTHAIINTAIEGAEAWMASLEVRPSSAYRYFTVCAENSVPQLTERSKTLLNFAKEAKGMIKG